MTNHQIEVYPISRPCLGSWGRPRVIQYEDKRKLQAKGIASVGTRVMNLREARQLVEPLDQKWAVTKQKICYDGLGSQQKSKNGLSLINKTL
jgi:hypothetical protein